MSSQSTVSSASMTALDSLREPEMGYKANLWYDDVSQGSWQSEQLQSFLQTKRGIVLCVIFDTIINIWDLADVVAAILITEISFQFGPALQH